MVESSSGAKLEEAKYGLRELLEELYNSKIGWFQKVSASAEDETKR